MKKKLLTIIACLAVVACLALTGCSATGSFSKVKVTGDAQNTGYTVYSNGGNSVQYGNYIYFINGTKGYEDSDQKQNVWGDVIKGALYRAELCGSASTAIPGDFDITVNADAKNSTGLEFKSTEGKDYDENPVDVVNVQLIAPKVIGTAGYKEGGLFIYGDYIYYATPNNERDKTGTVQVTKTDFMRSKLDGSETQKLYSTPDVNSTSPYAYYNYNDAVYLVCLSGSNLISVKVGKKVEKPVTIATNVTAAVLPYNTTYKKGMNTNTLQDFVYILRNVTESESITTGVAIEITRPDGSEGGTYLRMGNTGDSIEAVRDGMLFYRTTDAFGQTLINYDNLHNFMMEKSVSYKAHQESLDALASSDKPEDVEKYRNEKVLKNVDGTVMTMATATTYTGTYCFRPGGTQSDLVYAIATDTSGAYLKNNNIKDATFFYNAEMTFSFVEGEYAYFTDKDAKVLYRTEWNKAASDKSAEELKEQVSHGDMTDNGLRPDYCAGYVVYMGKVDEWADGYAFFKKVKGVTGATSVFVGEKIEADLKPEEEDDEDEDEKSGCGSNLVATVSGGVAAGAAVVLIGAGLLFMAYRPKKNRR